MDNRSQDIKILEDFSNCKNNPVYFIKNHIKVVHPLFGMVPFDLYPFQENLIKEFKDNRFTILRKFRQAGCTTLVAAYCLWCCTFIPHFRIVILSKDDDASVELLSRVKLAYDELPAYLKVGITKDNEHTLQFANKASIKSKASSKQSGRSIAGSLLILDEAAFIQNIDTIWAAAFPIISTGGSVIALSTVNGIGNWFQKMYTGAKNGENSFHAIDINWKDHPQYNRFNDPKYEKLYEDLAKRDPPILIDEWESVTRGAISHKEWLQEYECEFLGTGDTFVDGEILKQLKGEVNHNYHVRYRNRMRIWKEPNPSHNYVISVDTALGRGRDSSVFQVIDIYNGEQVAEFKSNVTPINEFAKIVAHEARVYNNAFVVPERNLIGHNFIYHLRDVEEYDNIFRDDRGELGIQTADSNRKQMLVEMDEAIRLNKVKINSERTVDELLTFIIDDNGKFKADENCHDDLTMALAFAIHAVKDLRMTTPMLEVQTNDEFKPINVISQSKYIYRTPTGGIEEEDLEWLLK